MARILDRFRHHFDPAEDERREIETTAAERKDADAFLKTDMYRRLRVFLDERSRDARYSPGMSAETAAAKLVEKTSFEDVKDWIDQTVVRLRRPGTDEAAGEDR